MINIHEPSSLIILSAIYIVISSGIRGSFVILSVLFVVPPPLLFLETINCKQYLKHTTNPKFRQHDKNAIIHGYSNY